MTTGNFGKVGQFVLSNGQTIKIRSVSPVLVQKASASVKMPPRPTYTAVTVSGREEIHPLDAESAQQTEGGVAQ